MGMSSYCSWKDLWTRLLNAPLTIKVHIKVKKVIIKTTRITITSTVGGKRSRTFMLGAKGKTETLLLSLVAKLPPSLLIRTARAQLLDSVYHSRKGKVRMSLKQKLCLDTTTNKARTDFAKKSIRYYWWASLLYGADLTTKWRESLLWKFLKDQSEKNGLNVLYILMPLWMCS